MPLFSAMNCLVMLKSCCYDHCYFSSTFDVDDSHNMPILSINHDVDQNLSSSSHYVAPAVKDTCVLYGDDIDLSQIMDKKQREKILNVMRARKHHAKVHQEKE